MTEKSDYEKKKEQLKKDLEELENLEKNRNNSDEAIGDIKNVLIPGFKNFVESTGNTIGNMIRNSGSPKKIANSEDTKLIKYKMSLKKLEQEKEKLRKKEIRTERRRKLWGLLIGLIGGSIPTVMDIDLISEPISAILSVAIGFLSGFTAYYFSNKNKLTVESGNRKSIVSAKTFRILKSLFYGALFMLITFETEYYTPSLLAGSLAGIFTYWKNKPIIEDKKIELDDAYMTSEWAIIMQEAEKDLEEILKAVTYSTNQEIRKKCSELYDSGFEILEYIRSNPKKLPQGRKFLSYYLDTAAKISKNYLSLEEKPMSEEKREKFEDDTNKALDLLQSGFEKQFSRLVENQMIDVETDVEVLESMLKWD